MRSAILLLALLLLAPSATLRAQNLLLVPVGSPVRVEAPSFRGIGYAAEASNDALTLIVENRADPVVVPFASMDDLSVRRPNSWQRGALRWAGWGALAGAAAFGASLLFVDYDFSDSSIEKEIDPYSTGALLIGGGAAAGAVYGGLNPGTRWEEARPPFFVRVTL